MNNVSFGSLVKVASAAQRVTAKQENVVELVKKAVEREARKTKQSSIIDALTLMKESDIFIKAQTDGNVALSVNKKVMYSKTSDRVVGSYVPVDHDGAELTEVLDLNKSTKIMSIKRQIEHFLKRCRAYMAKPENTANKKTEAKFVGKFKQTFYDEEI